MMNCQEVLDLLVGYLDGEITPSERTLINAHLDECAICGAELAALSTTQQDVRQFLQVRAAQVAPSPQALSRLQARLAPNTPLWLAWLRTILGRSAASVGRRTTRISRRRGNVRKRLAYVAVVALVVLVMVVLIIPNIAAPISAQEVLRCSADAQAATAKGSGILHVQKERYYDASALLSAAGQTGQRSPPERRIGEKYHDLQTGNARIVLLDAETSIVISAQGYDGAYIYYSDWSTTENPRRIYRTPVHGAPREEEYSPTHAFSLDSQRLFDQAVKDPKVEYIRQETWHDGRQVHVLRFKPKIEVLEDGRPAAASAEYVDEIDPMLAVPIASTMYFDAETCVLLETRETIERDGEEILVGYHRELLSEVLPADTPVAWDLTDLPGVSVVDAPPADDRGIHTSISLEELIAQASFTPYVLRTIPEGYELEISVVAIEKSTEYQEQSGKVYVITYRNRPGDFFELRMSTLVTPVVDPDQVIEAYETASGLKVSFSSSEAVPASAIIEAPDGSTFELMSNLPVERVKTLAEELIPAR